MRYKGRDYASGIDRKLSIIRPGATTMADESNVQGEYNGVPGRREQPNQWLRTYDRIQHSNRPDLQKKQREIWGEEQYHDRRNHH
jgi:hypothetical protein